MLVGVGVGVPLSTADSGGIQQETATLLAAMSTMPDAARQGVINTLITSLKSAGVWAKLDGLYVWAAADSQASLLNWVSPGTFTASAVNTPTFDADRGYTGDGSTSYLNTGYAPGTNGVNFTLNSHHLGIWVRNNVSSASARDTGNLNTYIDARNAGNILARSAQTTEDTFVHALTTSAGHSILVRDNSADFRTHKNGAAGVSAVKVSSTLGTLPFYALARSNTGPVADSFSTRQQAALHFGGALTGGEVTALYNALNAYMTAVGA